MTMSTLVEMPVASSDMLFEQALDGAMDTLMRLRRTAATELLLIRNAEPDYSTPSNVMNGDPALSERGRGQARRLAVSLRELGVEAIYASTSRSALETAAEPAAMCNLDVVPVSELRDLARTSAPVVSYGCDRQRLEAEICVRFANNPRWDALRGVEPTRPFRHRTIQAIEGIAAHFEGRRVAVVTHNANINAYFSMVLGIERDMFFHAEFTSVSTVAILRDLYGVRGLNDYSHLA